jgi:hypothetical protein
LSQETSYPPDLQLASRDLSFARRQRAGLAELIEIAVSTAAAEPLQAERTVAPAQRSRDPRAPWARFARPPWPLVAILLAQAALSLRLVWTNTAFADEALYLWSGHLEWTDWLHGYALPNFPSYFSGAPIVYPPLSALADTYGGLAGARILSLTFMILATCALYGTGTRIFSRRAGLFGAGLFASGAATQFLGAFATYDAMALMLLAAAVWLSVRSATCQYLLTRLGLLMTAGLAMALADATKYTATLFDPVVIAIGALMVWRTRGKAAGAAAGLTIFAVTVIAITAAIKIGGPQYWRGISYTTLSRAHGTSSPVGIVADSLGWAGLTALLAVFGVATVFVTRAPLPQRLLACVLAGAVALGPANQARIHVFTSLFKHVGFGAWFAAVVGGYALAALAYAVPKVKRRGATLASAAAVCLCTVVGLLLAQTHFLSWPDTTRFTAVLRAPLADRPGNVLADEGNVIQYYLARQADNSLFYGNGSFSYQHLTGMPAYAAAIQHQFFTVIALSFSGSQSTDQQLSRYIVSSGDYRLAATIPYELSGKQSAFRIWTAR